MSRSQLVAHCAFLAAAMPFLVAGCGGPSSEERFAERACSTTVPFAQQMLKASKDVSLTRPSQGQQAHAALSQLVFGGKQIAARFAARLRAVTAPDTDAGNKARTWLDIYAAAALEHMLREERQLRKLPENVSLVQSTRSLERIETAFVFVFSEMTGFSGPIRQFVPDLRTAFEKADSCKKLEAIGEN